MDAIIPARHPDPQADFVMNPQPEALSSPSPSPAEATEHAFVPSPDSDDAVWFSAEILVFDKSLRLYLRASFPRIRDIDDLVQETYARIVRARRRGAVSSPKAFLFATARNLAYDLCRHGKVISIESVANLDDLRVLEDRPDAAESAARIQECELAAAAVASLPNACRQVFTLRKVYHLSYREIAEKMGVSENTVNTQLTRGIERCRKFLAERGIQRGPRA
jgi:RNA polymerase sigma factor (sigma-70 family)